VARAMVAPDGNDRARRPICYIRPGRGHKAMFTRAGYSKTSASVLPATLIPFPVVAFSEEDCRRWKWKAPLTGESGINFFRRGHAPKCPCAVAREVGLVESRGDSSAEWDPVWQPAGSPRRAAGALGNRLSAEPFYAESNAGGKGDIFCLGCEKISDRRPRTGLS